MRFNEAIHQALVESVASFARVVEQALRDARDQLEARVEQRTQQLSALNEEMLAQVRGVHAPSRFAFACSRGRESAGGGTETQRS